MINKKNQKIKTKKFAKKTHFLQLSLLKFLYWRDTNLSVLSKKNKIETTVEQELLLVQNFFQFFKKNKLNFNQLVATSLSFSSVLKNNIRYSSITSNLFPQKQSFMYYWVLPFVGFVGLTYLNKNNEFKLYPSLQLWPYLTRDKNQNKTFNHCKESSKSVILEDKVCSLCWETLEYLNYKKLIYDESKKYVSQIYINEDNLNFLVNANWVEHQKNQYFITFKDKKLNNEFLQILDLEQKEIENLWKIYFRETQNFIYLQTNQQATNTYDNAFKSFSKDEIKKSKTTVLENMLAKNLWNLSSIYWYWYQFDPSDSFFVFPYSTLVGAEKTKQIFFNFAKNDVLGCSLLQPFGQTKTRRKNMSRREHQESLNNFKNIKGNNLFNLNKLKTLKFKNNNENIWVNLDEFPKKLFVFPSDSSHFSLKLIKNNKTKDKDKTSWKEPFFIFSCKQILEKYLTLCLFDNFKPEPIQSYQKASVLLDNFIKKLYLSSDAKTKGKENTKNKKITPKTTLLPYKSELYFNLDIYFTQQKNNFISTIQNKLNNIDQLKYQQQFFGVASNQTKNSFHVSKMFSLNLLNSVAYINSLNFIKSNKNLALISPNANKFTNSSAIKNKTRFFVSDFKKFSLFSGLDFSSIEVKKQICDDLQKIFLIKYLNFKTKNLQNSSISSNNPNRNLINQLKYKEKQQEIGPSSFRFPSLASSSSLCLWRKNNKTKRKTKKNDQSQNSSLCYSIKKDKNISKFLSILRKVKMTQDLSLLNFKLINPETKTDSSFSLFSTLFDKNTLTPESPQPLNFGQLSKHSNRNKFNFVFCSVKRLIFELSVLSQFNHSLKKLIASSNFNTNSKINSDLQNSKFFTLKKLQINNKLPDYSFSSTLWRKNNKTKSKENEKQNKNKRCCNFQSQIIPKIKNKSSFNNNLTRLKIFKLSSNSQNINLKKILNTAIQDQFSFSFGDKKEKREKKRLFSPETKKINEYSRILKLQNPLIMSGYEFPEFCIKDILNYRNKLTNKLKKYDNYNTKLTISFPPNFFITNVISLNEDKMKQIFKTQKKPIFRKKLTFGVVISSLKERQNFKNSKVTKQHRFKIYNYAQNSFLFQKSNDFVVKQNHQSHSNFYPFLFSRKNPFKTSIENPTFSRPLALSFLFQRKDKKILPKTAKSKKNDQVTTHFTKHNMLRKINFFSEYLQQFVSALLKKTTTLTINLLKAEQLKLLDQHTFESYLTRKDNKEQFCVPLSDKIQKNQLNLLNNQLKLVKLHKTKKVLKNSILFKNLEKRKVEKIFRTYLSCKSNDVIPVKQKTKTQNDHLFSVVGLKKLKDINNINFYYIKNALTKLRVRVKNNSLISNSGLSSILEKRKARFVFLPYNTNYNKKPFSHYYFVSPTFAKAKAKASKKYEKNKSSISSFSLRTKFKVAVNCNPYYSFSSSLWKRNNNIKGKKNKPEKKVPKGKLDQGENEKNKKAKRKLFVLNQKKNEIFNRFSYFNFLCDKMFISNKIKTKNTHLKLKFYQVSPNSLLKKLGFIFLNKPLSESTTNKTLLYFSGPENKKTPLANQREDKKKIKIFNDALVETQNVSSLSQLRERLEKQKYQQKKRRRKKQKLENRRRKKRKRFYPRPKWLRFQLYTNFLKKRHFKHAISCNFGAVKTLNQLQIKTAKIKFVQNNLLLFHKIKTFCETKTLETIKKGHKSNQLKFNDFDLQSTNSGLMGENKPIRFFSPYSSFSSIKNFVLKNNNRKTRNHYFENRVKNRLLKTKIYRQNKQQWGLSENPHFEKLTLKKMPLSWSLPVFADHNLYQISNEVMSDFQRLCWKSYWLRSNLTPYIQRIQSSMNKIYESQSNEHSSKTLKTFLLHMLGFNLPQISPHLFNNQTANKLVHSHKILSEGNVTDFKKLSIFLSSKKSPQLLWYLNLKQSFQNRNVVSNFSLFKNTQNIAEYNRILYDRISDVIKNVKINLNVNGQTHARSFKRGRYKSDRTVPINFSNNPNVSQPLASSQNFWSRFGRQISPDIRAFYPFASTIDASIKPYGDLPTLRVLWALNKTNILSFKQNNKVKTLWASFKTREQNKSNKTKKFIYNSWNKIFHFTKRNQNLDKFCFKKTKFVEDKIRYSGFLKKNYENYLICLKMQFKSLRLKNQYVYPLVEFSLGQTKDSNAISAGAFGFTSNKVGLDYQISESQPQKHPKRSMFFWWSHQQINLTSFFNQQSFYLTSSIVPDLQNFSIGYSSFLITSLWICTIVFHVCSLFCLFSISEIRSLMKFNLLIFYKISNSYLIVIYSIYDLLKNYKNQINFNFVFIQNKFSARFSFREKIARPKANHFYSSTTADNSLFSVLLKNQILTKNQEKNKKTLFKNKTLNSKMNLALAFASAKVEEEIRREQKTKHQGEEAFPLVDQRQKSNKLYSFLFKQARKQIQKYQTYKLTHFKNIYYLAQNGSFLETTFRAPKVWSNRLLTISTNKTTSNKNIYISKPLIYSFNFNSGLWPSTSAYNALALAFASAKVGEQIKTKQKTKHLSIFSRKHQKKLIISEIKTINLMRSVFLNEIKTHFYNLKFLNIKNKKIQLKFSLFLLFIAKLTIVCVDNFIQFGYKILFKFVDVVESFMLVIYKFLEKPAELMIEWIAQIFLVEWCSDIMAYLPEAFDSSIWNSYVKLSRNSRILGPVGFLIQRRLWCFMEILIDFVSKPDADLIMRQKKGMIFWHIWAEILIQAAERYNINIPSLTTLKEEQELLIEKLLEDENWDWCKTSMIQMIPLINLIENSNQRPNAKAKFEINKTHSALEKNFIAKNRSSSKYLTLAKAKTHQNFKFTTFEEKTFSYYFFSLLKQDFQIIQNWSRVNEMYENLTWKRWSTNQYSTYQGRDTELFIDIHPPKSFRHMSAIKYYQPAQQTLGSLVCQIYSGLFSKQVSKNILVVGAAGSGKSLLVQALAGETELKIITDNAHRYALIQRGVAVGMKLLKDVFDAIALHTPCLFLMEDIHVIGERRPMLISDDENAKAAESFFASENEEVHEKNQLIYQLNKHAISHYKKPYKGDFSLLIPTNHFCFDLFLGVSPPKTRRLGITSKSPLPIESIESELHKSQNETNAAQNFNLSSNKKFPFDTLISHLQIPSEKLFAPPPTSPFTILMMKEQKKLKPKKLVKQIPWGGLSWDQMMLVSKINYSIRVKVALLADIAISNLSVKLDMITDLLVIMDSVRSNRGFVVFATTHVPFILDPALRRPGRLDETISLPLLPNLINRWEILKTNFCNFTSTLDFVDYSMLSANLTDSQISNFISKTKLLLFNTKTDMALIKKYSSFTHNAFDLYNKKTIVPINLSLTDNQKLLSKNEVPDCSKLQPRTKFLGRRKKNNKIKNNIDSYTQYQSKFPIYSLNQAVKLTTNADTTAPVQICNKIQKAKTKLTKNKKLKQIQLSSFHKVLLGSSHYTLVGNSLLKLLKSFEIYPSIPPNSSNLISLTYFQMGKFLINSQLVLDQTSYGLITWSKFLVSHNLEQNIFRDLYCVRSDLKNQLMRLFSGKIGEFFIFNNSSLCRYFLKTQNISRDLKTSNISNADIFTAQNSAFGGPKGRLASFSHSGFWNAVGIHPFWNSANSFVTSLIQKRYLYNKNLLVSRMLYFEDISTLREPPSPPNSSILMPAKKYENLKRTENDFQQKATMSIHEKIQIHQQQRLMKKLYNKPIQEYFHSEMIENRVTKFSNSVKELGYLNSFTTKPSSVNCYYKNRILIRHKFSLMNQWWNGQLAEHNAETTFLSDVDWRSIFNKSLGDLLIDFPDADQHYNPRHRRWFLQSSHWGYWLDFNKTMTQEISYHFMIQCFNKAYNFLNNEREILDYFAYSFLQKGLLKEIHLVTTLSRFYHNPASFSKKSN